MDTNPSRANSHETAETHDNSVEAGGASSPSQSSRPQEACNTIREMARDFGVSVRALRFYEDRGLLRPTRDGATRLYSARERRNLKMILKGKQLGFTLAEIHELLSSKSGAMAEITERDGDNLLDSDEGNLELALPPEQIIAQIGHLERQRKELDAAIVALQSAHRRLLESSCRLAIA